MSEDAIKLIVGLGNPGGQYESTRHNAGFWFIDELVRQHNCHLKSESRFHGEVSKLHLGSRDCLLLKPTTFMNRSGQSVSSLAKYYQIPASGILVVHDELDLAPGTVRFKLGGGHAGNNGLRDIISALGTKDFYRVRVGIGHPGHRSDVSDYVLSRPSRDDADLINNKLDDVIAALPKILAGEYQQVMHHLHTN